MHVTGRTLDFKNVNFSTPVSCLKDIRIVECS